MEQIFIRQATPGEVEQLREIGRQTFLEAFSEGNSGENMQKYLEERFSREKLLAELQDPDALFYFAVSEDDIVGYLKLNTGKAQTELQEDHAVEIERIYVRKEFYGQKVGQALYDQAIHIARQKKASYIWLGVWEENHRAINFYSKNGFVPFDKHIFKLGDDEQTDIMMKLIL